VSVRDPGAQRGAGNQLRHQQVVRWKRGANRDIVPYSTHAPAEDCRSPIRDRTFAPFPTLTTQYNIINIGFNARMVSLSRGQSLAGYGKASRK